MFCPGGEKSWLKGFGFRRRAPRTELLHSLIVLPHVNSICPPSGRCHRVTSDPGIPLLWVRVKLYCSQRGSCLDCLATGWKQTMRRVSTRCTYDGDYSHLCAQVHTWKTLFDRLVLQRRSSVCRRAATISQPKESWSPIILLIDRLSHF